MRRRNSVVTATLWMLLLVSAPLLATEPDPNCEKKMHSNNFRLGYTAFHKSKWDRVIELMSADLEEERKGKKPPRSQCEGVEADVDGAMGEVKYVPSYFIAIARCNLRQCNQCLEEPVLTSGSSQLALCPEGDPDWVNKEQRRPEQLCLDTCPRSSCFQCSAGGGS